MKLKVLRCNVREVIFACTLSRDLTQIYHTLHTTLNRSVQYFNNKVNVKWAMILVLLLYSVTLAAQSNSFVITGKFKIDGGSNSDAKIVVEKDGQKVRTVPGDARFTIEMDYQAVYLISFVKEGYVTKKLRFDTHVPESRIEYGFEPFDFTIELFEQYEGVNTVVFNQPVGKIAYSEVIDEFDYDTDYTKSIQTQIEQTMQQVEEKKEEKLQAEAQKQAQEAQVVKQVSTLTSAGDKNASAGKLTEALQNYEEAAKLKDSPAIQQKIADVKQKIAGQQQQQQKEEEFKKLVATAQSTAAAGQLEEARKLFEQANTLKAGDATVKAELDKINKLIQENAQKEQQFKTLATAAQEAAKAQNWAEAATKAEQALKLKADPAMEKLKSDAQATIAAQNAQQAAAQEKKASYDKLVAEGDKAAVAKDHVAAIAKYEEAAKLINDPQVQQKLKAAQEAMAEVARAGAEAEQRRQQAGQLLAEAQAAMAKGDLAGARQKANAAGELMEDPRVAELLGRIEAEEKRIQKEQQASQEKETRYNALITAAQGSLGAGDLDKAQAGFTEAGTLFPGREEAATGLAQVQAKRSELEAARKQGEEDAAKQKAAFDALLAEGQAALAKGELEAARSAFTKAGEMFSDKRVEKGLKDVELEMQKQLASAQADAQKKAQYEKLVAEGTSAMAAGELDNAEKAFNGALAIMEDASVRAKLAEISNIRKQQAQEKSAEAELAGEKAAAAQKEKEFDAKKTAGDKAFAKQGWDEAEAAYNAALAIREDAYVRGQLASIGQERQRLAEAASRQADAKAQEERYALKIKEADLLFGKNDFNGAETAYRDALAIKPGAAHPSSRLEEIAAKRAGQQAEEAKSKAEEAQATAAQEAARKKKEFETMVMEGDKLFKANDLKGAKERFTAALAIQEDAEVVARIAKIDGILRQRLEEQQKAEEAALALADNRGRESKELASIILEEQKSQTVAKPETASPQIAQDLPRAANTGPVIISEPKVGKEALNTPSARLSEEAKFDAIAKRAEVEQEEYKKEREQIELKEKYKERKTVESEKVGNSTVTYIYINRGEFVTVYKKVEHNWGGVFYFIDDRPTTQRFWEHETQ